MTTYYLAGPMTGVPKFNFPLFDEVAAVLRRRGNSVINPADHDREVAAAAGVGDPSTCDGYETGDISKYHASMGTSYESLLGWDIVQIVQQCEGVIFLPGWEHSVGAGHEMYVANATGKLIKYAHPVQRGWLFLSYPCVPECDLDLERLLLEEDDLELEARIISSGPLVVSEERKVGKVTVGPWEHEDEGEEEDHPCTVIGLMGYAQSGKDTLAAELVRDYGFQRIAFADTLRECLYALNPQLHNGQTGTMRDEFGDLWHGPTTVQKLVDLVGWDRAKVGNPEVRALLQRLGTEVGRDILGTDIWVETAMKKIQPGGKYVITDMRFPNEHLAVIKLGGKTVRIFRAGTRPVNGHWSETALDGYESDVVLLNNGTPQEMAAFVAKELGL